MDTTNAPAAAMAHSSQCKGLKCSKTAIAGACTSSSDALTVASTTSLAAMPCSLLRLAVMPALAKVSATNAMARACSTPRPSFRLRT